MFSSRKTTLLFIGRDRIARLDVDGGGRVLGMWQRERAVSAELPELIDTALRLDRARPGKTWVLAEDFWTQKLTVAHDLLAGLSPAEASRALAFEAESLSGQSAIDSELTFIRLEGTRERAEYWVLQIPYWIRNQAESSVLRVGGQLAGLLHPAGLPALVGGQATGPWGRLEIWSGVTLAMGQGQDGRWKLGIAASDTRTPAWQRSIDAWLAALGPVSLLQSLSERPQTLPLAQRVEALNLQDEHTLRTWLQQWALTLARSAEPVVPHVRPPKRPISQTARLAIALALFLLVGMAAAADRLWANWRTAALNAEIASYQQQDTDQAAAQKEVAELDKKIEEEQKRIDRLAAEIPHIETAVSAFRRRWTELLGILAKTCPNEVVVQQIESEGTGLKIKGVSLGHAPLNDFAVALGKQLAPLGWSVAPGLELTAIHLEHGKVYSFSLQLEHRSLLPTTPAAPASDVAQTAGEGVTR